MASENILHFGAIRTRVTGAGNLQLFLRSLSNTKSVQLSSIVMKVATDIEPTVLANFTSQRAQLEIKTTAINETFNVSKIIVFIKTIATGYPQ